MVKCFWVGICHFLLLNCRSAGGIRRRRRRGKRNYRYSSIPVVMRQSRIHREHLQHARTICVITLVSNAAIPSASLITSYSSSSNFCWEGIHRSPAIIKYRTASKYTLMSSSATPTSYYYPFLDDKTCPKEAITAQLNAEMWQFLTGTATGRAPVCNGSSLPPPDANDVLAFQFITDNHHEADLVNGASKHRVASSLALSYRALLSSPTTNHITSPPGQRIKHREKESQPAQQQQQKVKADDERTSSPLLPPCSRSQPSGPS
ncbi:hypothetical protein V8C44DRAFT_62940 [Trichoderma aethiopicum]